jgi:hypothetical protein
MPSPKQWIDVLNNNDEKQRRKEVIDLVKMNSTDPLSNYKSDPDFVNGLRAMRKLLADFGLPSF